jgi:putative ABC transport system permease protein
MFYLTYLRQELRRRLGRTLLTVLGLAVGVAVVVAVTSLSSGLDKAQKTVLGPLAGVGTDLTVTKQEFVPGGLTTLLTGGLQTDLSKLGKPGDKFTTDTFIDTQPAFDASEPTQISHVTGVQTTSTALILRGLHQTGTIPKITATIEAGGQTVTQTQKIAPMTPAEQAAFNKCMAANQPANTPAPGGGGGGFEGDGGGGGGRFAAVQKCLPSRFANQTFSFRTPRQRLSTDVNTPTTNIQSRPYMIAGIQPNADIGMISSQQVVKGTFLQSTGQAMVSQSYASAQKLDVGSTLTIKTTNFKVVGIVQPPLGGQAADIYVPLTDLQTVSGHTNQVNVVMARATSASKVAAVSSAISKDVPSTSVSDASDLAKSVAGSLVDSGNLIKNLGLVLAVVGLIAAFLIAIFLTLSSVAKRTRELGTLKAIGWAPRLVVRQIVGETVTQGVLGGAVGIGLGVLASSLLGTFAPSLTARAVDNGPGAGGGPRFFGFGRFAAAQTQHAVKLTAPVSPSWLLIAGALAIAGGLVAGLIGAMRAARLRPADAMRDVG